jgi:D-cysteine desulfhydrase
VKTPASLPLAHRPTPLEPLHDSRIRLSIKRDDLTGAVLSGNKVRKLEFLLAEAQAQQADMVITCGGIQSNHARATAVAAATAGMQSTLFLRGQQAPVSDGNVLLDRLVGARIKYITREQYSTQRTELMNAEAQRLAEEEGRRVCVIPEGGSSALGCWGYIEAVRELLSQRSTPPDYVVCATGSGGTQAGLILGCRLLCPQTQVLGVNVCDDEAYFKRVIGGLLAAWQDRWDTLGLTADDVTVVDGHVGLGYAQNTSAELEALVALARDTGLILDPVYTLKGWLGLQAMIGSGRIPSGSDVVFFHTGGVFGLFPKRDELEPLL